MAENIVMFFVICFCSLFVIAQCSNENSPVKHDKEKGLEGNEEKLTYAKGSLCGYCDYCKFCKLCDDDCPCEPGPKQPNCHMCKYCKYCYLCSGLCDTICQPGGIIDKVSSTLVSTLSSEVDKDEVDQDIENVRDWIEKKKDEL